MMRPRERWTARLFTAVIPICLLLAVGCGKKNQQTAENPNAPAPAESANAKTSPAPNLTDANIAAIVVAANNVDINNGEVAKTKASTPAVKQFAQMMIKDHGSVNQKAKALVAKLGIQPEENDASRKLVEDGDHKRADMQTKTGMDFDKFYIDDEVDYHQAVLDKIDKDLIPSAQNPQLKSLLETVRPAVAQHLEHAKQIQSELKNAKT